MAFVELPMLGGAHMLLAAGSVFRLSSVPEGTRVEFGAEKQSITMALDALVPMLETAGARLVELTRPDGSRCFLNASAISVVRDADAQEPTGSKAVVTVAGQKQAVRQTRQQVHQALEGSSSPAV